MLARYPRRMRIALACRASVLQTARGREVRRLAVPADSRHRGVHYLEHLVPFWWRTGDLAQANHRLLDEIVWARDRRPGGQEDVLRGVLDIEPYAPSTGSEEVG